MQYQFVKQVLEEADFDSLASLDIFENNGQQYAGMCFRLNPRKTYGPFDPRPDSVYLTDGASPRRLFVTGELTMEEPAMNPEQEAPTTAPDTEETEQPQTETADTETVAEATPEQPEETAAAETEAAPAEEAPEENVTAVGLGDAAGGQSA